MQVPASREAGPPGPGPLAAAGRPADNEAGLPEVAFRSPSPGRSPRPADGGSPLDRPGSTPRGYRARRLADSGMVAVGPSTRVTRAPPGRPRRDHRIGRQ